MGQFSWITADTKKQILCNQWHKVYVLVPETYGGKSIMETCYDGYGHFGGYDIYELVAIWNKGFLTKENIEKPTLEEYDGNEYYYQSAVKRYEHNLQRIYDYQSGKSEEYMCKTYGDDWSRELGICIAYSDKRNKSLKYPIKIAEKEDAVYEKESYSKVDKKQGWKY